ncbi:hypothetical protein Dsin_018579 [Dipteronia sinensis]|uniref:Retrotransposon gag domain-containing protein n=1 Tax=Dipteronia sinensis TaxID=43782 RepID=A0AAE0A741_9ROSI|nr:hypothetical protein Dsin_018579 [Dipteronia sinensis]
MKDYSRPIVNNHPLCNALDEAARNYELKSFHYNLLPAFHGLPNEDVLKFLREFYAAIQAFPNNRVTENQLRMRCIPHALKEKKTSEIRDKITNFFQGDQETFYEVWERYKILLFDCPQHGYHTHQLCQWFYDGLNDVSTVLVNNACGGSMTDKTPEDLQSIFEKLANNSHQKSSRRRKGIYEVDANTENSMQMSQMQKSIELLVNQVGQMRENRYMGCEQPGYDADVQMGGPRPSNLEEAQAMNNYNQGWEIPTSLGATIRVLGKKWRKNNQRQYNAGAQNSEYQPKNLSLEDTMKEFMQTTQQMLKETHQDYNVRFQNIDASIRKMELQIGQLAEANQKREQGKFPSHTEQAKAITILWNGFSKENSAPVEDEEFKVEKSKDTSKIHKSPNPYVPPVPFQPEFKETSSTNHSRRSTTYCQRTMLVCKPWK